MAFYYQVSKIYNQQIEVVGNKTQVYSTKLNQTDDYLLNLKEADFDSDVTVIKVSLNGPIQLVGGYTRNAFAARPVRSAPTARFNQPD